MKQYQDTGWNTEKTAATLYDYDSFGNQVKQTLALNATPTKDNSPVVEQVSSVESAEDGVYSVTTQTRYNAEGTALNTTQKQLISQLSATLASKSISIDMRGNSSVNWSEYTAPTKVSSFSTVPTSNITAESISIDGFTISQKDHADNEVITTDPSERVDGDVTTWCFDAVTGLEQTKTYADNTSVVKNYDGYNRLTTETDARGNVKTHSYETARGLLLGTIYSDSTAARCYTYNHLGQLLFVTDDAGTRTLGYNSYGEQVTDSLLAGDVTHLITEIRDAFGRSVGYTYAKNGTVQHTVTTGYGSDGRIATAGFMHGGAEKQFVYDYLSGSNLLQTLSMPCNMTLTQSYETQRNLVTGMAYRRGATLVTQRNYSYDTLGQPLTRSTARNGQTVNDSFVHNSRFELANAQVNGSTYGYDYDNIGNRRMAMEASDYTLYEANNLNQYTSIQENEDSAFVPAFDADGNQTLVKTATGIWSVLYNAENRPIRFTKADGATVIECNYDTHGRRATKKVLNNGRVTLHQRFLYRGYQQIACCDLTRTDHPCLWLLTWDPTQGLASRPLAIRKDATWYAYGWDLTKNICEVFGPAGYIRTSYVYTPYGEVTSIGDVEQFLQWSSEYRDIELDMVYYNYRYYNPKDGKWICRDPQGESASFNLFSMCNNSPILYIDYLGLDSGSESTSGFTGRVTCERSFARVLVSPPKIMSRLLKSIGIEKFKTRIIFQNKKCEGCCKGSGIRGKSSSVSITGQIEGEAGGTTLDILNVATIRFGWYGRLGGTGSFSVSRNSCNNLLTGSGCFTIYGEIGLIGRAMTMNDFLDVGARGGLNVSASVCSSENRERIDLKAKLCASVRARIWLGGKIWPFKHMDLNKEWQDQICTPWFIIGKYSF